MSRKGNKLVQIPQGVQVIINANNVDVKGKLGALNVSYPPEVITLTMKDNSVKVDRKNDLKQSKMYHGTVNSNLHNAIIGVNQGFRKILKITGVGYKAAISNNQLILNIGFTHPVIFDIPEGLTVVCTTPTQIDIFGADKIVVGEFAANVRVVRKPEPYKGKGIAYSDEHIIRKVGKTAEGSKK